MRKIAISLSKGGVGKTTTAVNLAAGLAQLGKRVILIDTDTQGQAAKALGVDPTAGMAELAAGEKPFAEVMTPARERLWVIGGGRALAGIKRLIDRRDFGGEQLVAEALAPAEDLADYVILDTSPGWDALTVNILFYADEVLCPVSLEIMSLQGLVDFGQNLAAIQRYRPALTLRYVVPTFLDRRVRKSVEILEQLQRHYPQQICPAIRYNVKLSEAPGFGQSIYEYAPTSPGAEDYHHLVERIAGDA